MPMTWEAYVRSQEVPEECPVCGKDWCGEDGVPLVPDHPDPLLQRNVRHQRRRGVRVSQRALQRHGEEVMP